MKITVIEIIWFIITIIAAALPFITFKKYTLTHNKEYLVITILIGIILLIGYINILERFPIYSLYPIWFISMLIVLFSGPLLFGEKLKLINVIGIIIGMVGIFLLVK